MDIYLNPNFILKSVDILNGYVVSKKADNTLNSATVIFHDISNKPLEPFTLVKQDFIYYFIFSDTVEQYTFLEPIKYTHTCVLVSLTKILEKFYNQSHFDTDVTGRTIYNQLERFISNINVIIGNGFSKINSKYTYQLVLSGDWTKIQSYVAEEVVVEESTIREIFNYILSPTNCRIIVSGLDYVQETSVININLSFIDMNTRIDGNISDFLKLSADNDGDEFFGSITANVKNGRTNTTIHQVDTAKTSSTVTADTNNRVILFSEPIEYITEFNVAGNVSITIEWLSQTPDMPPIIDIISLTSKNFVNATDFFVDKEYWNTLDEIAKRSYLYYQRGETSTDLSRTYKDLIITKSQFVDFLKKVFGIYIENNYTPPQGYVFGNVANITPNDIDSFIFDYSYIATMDCVLSSTKQRRDYRSTALTLIDNQSDGQIDLLRYGVNLGGKARRLGNNKLIIDCKINSLEDLKPLFTTIQIDNEPYVLTSLTYATYKRSPLIGFYQVNYEFNKDFNAINSKVGVDKEKRIYKIPLTGYKNLIPFKTFTCIGFSNKFNMIEDFCRPTTQNIIARNIAVHLIADTNVPIPINERSKIDFCKVAVSTTSGSSAYDKNFILSCSAFSSGKQINLKTQFYDNYSSGLSVTQNQSIFSWIGGKKVAHNPYVNNLGKAYKFKAEFGTFFEARTLAQIQAQPTFIGNPDDFEKYATITFSYEKDRAESLLFQYINEIVSIDKDIVIGDEITKNMAIFSGSIEDAWIYTSNDLYVGGDSKCKGTRQGKASSMFQLMQTIGDFHLKVTGVYQNEHNSVAIGNANGDLYIGINRKPLINEEIRIRDSQLAFIPY